MLVMDELIITTVAIDVVILLIVILILCLLQIADVTLLLVF